MSENKLASQIDKSKYTILLAEDEKIAREGCEEFLKDRGFSVISVKNGKEALDRYVEADIVILDIMMPVMTGIEVLEKIRSVSDIPIIMLTALSDESTQVTTFNKLADDYVTKPFSLILLEKRIESILRRKIEKDIEVWNYRDAKVDFLAFKGYFKNEDALLTTKEIQVLKLLIDNKNIALTRDKILSHIWQEGDEPFDRIIDVYIKNLRKKLGLECIKTVKGIGYMYEEN